MYKKIAIAAFVNLVVGLGINWLLTLYMPTVTQEYQNSSIFRSWQDPLMTAYFVYPLVHAFASWYLWSLVSGKLNGNSSGKAFNFAKLYFVVATIPGMFISYTSLQLSFTMIVVWFLTGFIQAFVAGYVFVKVR